MLNNLYTFSVPVFLRGHAVLSENSKDSKVTKPRRR